MPTHKGIKMTIVSQVEFQVHPEFAHPESSQFTHRSPSVRGAAVAHLASSRPVASPSPNQSKADRILGRQSAVSVYIPSVPGARFWLRYNIDEEAAQEAPWYFFKLSMNGSNIASWGTNSKTSGSEQVMRGLFEPSSKWNYRYEGTTFKCMGTETRPFFFAKEDEERSAGNDGGMIEIKVYRAAGRRRKMPEPIDFKSQERYGIVMPSSGLFDNPEDARFYDWRLIDAKDAPLHVFRFHYRSWDSLESLQLIPPDYPRKLLPSSASILSLHGLSRELQEKLRVAESYDEVSEAEVGTEARSSLDSQLSDTPWLTPVFDDNSSEEMEALMALEPQEAFLVPDPDDTPLYPDRMESPSPDKLASAVVDKPLSSPVTSDTEHWRGRRDRPLPQVPSRRSSLKHLRRHARKTSEGSTAPSITSSLRSYADRDTPSPEPELKMAVAVLTQVKNPSFDQQDAIGSESEYSLSPNKYSDSPNKDDKLHPENSPGKAEKRGFLSRSFRRSASRKNKIISDSPSNHPTLPNRPGVTPPPVLLPNVTVRKTRNSPPKTPLPKTPLKLKKNQPRLQMQSPVMGGEGGDGSALMNTTTTTTLSESEWMRRTPSPLKKSLVLRDNGSVLREQGNVSPVLPRMMDGYDYDSGFSGLAREENRRDAFGNEGRSPRAARKMDGYDNNLLSLAMDENRRIGIGSSPGSGRKMRGEDGSAGGMGMGTGMGEKRGVSGFASDGKASLRRKVVGWYRKDGHGHGHGDGSVSGVDENANILNGAGGAGGKRGDLRKAFEVDGHGEGMREGVRGGQIDGNWI